MQVKINAIKKRIEEEGFRFQVGKFEDHHRYRISFVGPHGQNQWLCRNYDEIEKAFIEAIKTREQKLRLLEAYPQKSMSDLEGQIAHVHLIHIKSNYNNDIECRFEFLDGPFMGRTIHKIFSQADINELGLMLKMD